jgi:signal transduction histidine kinase
MSTNPEAAGCSSISAADLVTHSWPEGGGEMGALIRRFDWTSTPIGPIESWSPALRMMVRFLLANRFPLLLWWGPQYVSIYNDAYRPVLGKKHPWALGLPVRECWSEIWHVLQPLIDTPFKGGPATWNEDIQLELNRHGFAEETHFTIAYSPVPDETVPTGIGGVLATVHEITDKIIGERRVVALRDLGARVGDAKSADDACHIAARTLSAHDKDVPFCLLYLIEAEGRVARLAGAAGVADHHDFAPTRVDLDDVSDQRWPLTRAIRDASMQVVTPLEEHFTSVPAGPWSDPPRTAVVMTIPSTRGEPVGIMVAGVSARQQLDDYHKDFLELVRTQIAAAVGHARAYEEERQRAEALAELDRAKTVFFSNVSHEFRTPLTLMLGPLEEILSDADIAPHHRDALMLTHRNALRLRKLVNTLLDFSRIEAGRIGAAYEPVDIAVFTAELASVFRAAIDKAGLRFVVDCRDIGEPVYVDREMWEKVILNLISNAFKFTLAGEIGVTVRRDGWRAAVEVRDTGCGIPATELPHIFERFHRVAGTPGRTHEGTGIGLALVQELVKLHGGSITVDSEVGSGTRVNVSVPLGHAHLPAERIVSTRSLTSTAVSADAFVEEALRWLPDAPADAAPSDRDDDRCILVADDNADMRAYLRRLLSRRWQVEIVGNGEEAIAFLRGRRPNLVIADVMMPKVDGFALLREMRANPAMRDIPVLMLSARAGDESRMEGLQAGADD